MAISIHQAEDGLAKNTSTYTRELGTLSAFLSPARRSAYHRINVEYALANANASLSDIREAPCEGNRLNAELLNVTQDIASSMDSIAEEMSQQSSLLRRSNQILQELLEVTKSPRATEATELCQQARENIDAAKTIPKARTEKLLEEAITLLIEGTSINRADYRSHFDLGWLYMIYKNDPPKAIECFDEAVSRSLSHDPDFATMAYRHMADCHRELGDLPKAMEVLDEAKEARSECPSELTIDLADVYLASGVEYENVKKVVVDLIEKQPICYEAVALHPRLGGDSRMGEFLSGMRKTRLEKACGDAVTFFSTDWDGNLRYEGHWWVVATARKKGVTVVFQGPL